MTGCKSGLKLTKCQRDRLENRHPINPLYPIFNGYHPLAALFLHGGPGFTASVERRWFGESLPIDWWDQPRLSAAQSEPLKTLTEAAADRLRSLAEESGFTVDLVAHSSGGLIARELCDAIPHLIGHVTLLACSIDLAQALLRMARHMSITGRTNDELCSLIASVDSDLDPERFLAMVGVLLSTPGLLSHYFARDSKATEQRYFALAPNGPEFDFDTFKQALREQLARRPVIAPSMFRGNVTLLFGSHDPLTGPEDPTSWQVIFPRAVQRVLPAGHMLHFEIEPALWLHSMHAL